MRVLAVTHMASRTGAVLAFVEALPVLRDLGTELVIVNKDPGPLSPLLQASADEFLEVPRPLLSQGRRIARVPALDRFVPPIERAIARSVVREVRPDLVYASTVLSSEYATAAQRLGIPVCLHVHESQPLSGWALGRSAADITALPMVAPSEFIARELHALSGRTVPALPGPLRPMVAGTGGSTADLPWTGRSLRVVGCGTVAAWKGTEQWLAAAEQLAAVDGRTVEWAWVGSGDQLSLLREETHRRGLAGRVHWVGEQQDVASYLASADLFVLCSASEALGLVLLEAAAVGVASVGFESGGVREVLVDDRALVRVGDVAGLVDKVESALRDPALRAELLEASRPALTARDPANWRRRLAQVLDDVAHGGPGTGEAP